MSAATLTGMRRPMVGYALLALFGLLGLAPLILSYSIGPNYHNISVDAIVNVTQSKPEVISVLINDGSANITLSAGTTKKVICNATIRDYNGGATITEVNGTLFFNNTSFETDADDNNTHYSNTSCTSVNANGYYNNFTCVFDVLYYANNGTWVCNVTAKDPYDFNGDDTGSNFNTTMFDPLLAINVTNPIDYGDLAVGDTSGIVDANITNFGNRNINITVRGYGNESGDGLAMVCEFGNITVDNERWSLNATDVWASMTPLTSASDMIGNMTIAQQLNDSDQEWNRTYWRLYVPPNPFGFCNGTVVFEANDAQG